VMRIILISTYTLSNVRIIRIIKMNLEGNVTYVAEMRNV
jgi:hypothetical protein